MTGQAGLLLHALAFPKADEFSAVLDDDDRYKAVVVWLENMKIRALKIADRKGLTENQGPSWNDSFKKYLEEVECPVPLEPGRKLEVLEWLLRYAVHLEYSDKAEALTPKQAAAGAAAGPGAGRASSGAQASASGAPAASKAKAQPFADYASPDVSFSAQQLAEALHISTQGMTLLQVLQAARDVLGEQVLPALAEAERKSGQKGGSTGAHSLSDLPLGFDTGDSKLDAAARVLRLMYVRDLRGLQSAVDAAIVAVQDYSANPKTDSSLGKVGR